MPLRPLTDSLVLRIWEEGARQHVLDRMLTVLAIAYPELDRQAHAALPIGRRDAELLSLHESEFGPEVQGIAVCPECRQRVSFSLRIQEIRMKNSQTDGNRIVNSGGYCLGFRLADSFDLAAAAVTRDPESAKAILLARCVVDAKCNGLPVETAALPAAVVDELSTAMSAADPQSDVECSFECMDCGAKWAAIFDIALFIWDRIARRARAVIDEVHALASAYGWGEDEILAMSGARRGLYLQRVSDV